MALFLIVAGSTGVVLAFYDELDTWLNPSLYRVKPREQHLDFDTLVSRVDEFALKGQATVRYIRFAAQPQDSIRMIVAPTRNRVQQPHNIDFDWLFVDPYTGEVLGKRRFGAWRFDRAHLMPLIYKLHYSLALPSPWGKWLFGAAALIWVLDCFVAFYLTLPRKHRSFFNKWQKSWGINWQAGAARLTRDLHIAVSLWLWGMLLVLALSSVMFNLFREVYQPVVSRLVPYERVQDNLPNVSVEQKNTALSFSQAHAIAREHIQQWQREKAFTVFSEDSLSYDSSKHVYRYRAKSSLDLPASYSQTRLYFSASDGRLLAREHAYLDTGNAITTWLAALHMGKVFGRWYQILISVMGVVVTGVTVTGVLIWWRKRRVVKPRKNSAREPSTESCPLPRHRSEPQQQFY